MRILAVDFQVRRDCHPVARAGFVDGSGREQFLTRWDREFAVGGAEFWHVNRVELRSLKMGSLRFLGISWILSLSPPTSNSKGCDENCAVMDESHADLL